MPKRPKHLAIRHGQGQFWRQNQPRTVEIPVQSAQQTHVAHETPAKRTRDGRELTASHKATNAPYFMVEGLILICVSQSQFAASEARGH